MLVPERGEPTTKIGLLIWSVDSGIFLIEWIIGGKIDFRSN